MDVVTLMQEKTKGLFPELLGVRFLEATSERVKASLIVRSDLRTTRNVMHGDAIMAFADTLGGYATALNLPQGANTTTVESKTNFFASASVSSPVIGECVALHRGKRTMVWQTRVVDGNDKLLALVTQTQIVLEPQLSPQETMARRFEGKATAEQKTLLAQLERGGALLYHKLAADEPNPNLREALLAAAAREEENASMLESGRGNS